jgi:hypothetical protein
VKDYDIRIRVLCKLRQHFLLHIIAIGHIIISKKANIALRILQTHIAVNPHAPSVGSEHPGSVSLKLQFLKGRYVRLIGEENIGMDIHLFNFGKILLVHGRTQNFQFAHLETSPF